ncbi:MAG TPA: hypothetical protein PKC18_10410 [Lacipirellulaceae bacterium]|nr:hypothetical protein [Lacipirellulaceae bacterium]HMP06323.1 hypothetical protein [Lacipirellulaceae bacterium]
MSSENAVPAGEFEFSEADNRLIGQLARRMGLVGFAMTLFGILQIVNGLSSLFLARNPDRMIAAAEKAGMGADQLEILKTALAGGSWSSPLAASAIAFAFVGLLLFLVGLWTRQSAWGFLGIVLTQGKDVSRLMDALGALNRKYGVMYYTLLTAALVSLVSLATTLWHSWRGGA